jgi:hypothetical protein
MKCPDGDRDQRSPRGGTGNCGFMPLIPPQEHRRRGVHRRAVLQKPAEYTDPDASANARSLRAAAVPVRELPVRALPEVHGSRQGRLVQGARRHGAFPVRLDQGLRARQSRAAR